MGHPALQIDFKRKYTSAEYYELLEKVDMRLELIDGYLVDWRMMAGANDQHELIAANLTGELRTALRGSPCRVYGSGLVLRIPKRAKHRLGDLSVVCGPTEYDPEDTSANKAVMNPKVVFEVLSPTSEKDDRTEKFRDYMLIPSLSEYVLVSQESARVETFLRQEDGAWRFESFDGLEATARLRSLQIDLSLRELYDNVTFPKTQVPEA